MADTLARRTRGGTRLQNAVERPEAHEPDVAGAEAKADVDEGRRHEATRQDDPRRRTRAQHAAQELAEPCRKSGFQLIFRDVTP